MVFTLTTLHIIVQVVVIQPDDDIRLKIVGTRVDAGGIVSMCCNSLPYKSENYYKNAFLLFQFAIGTLMDDYLGKYTFFSPKYVQKPLHKLMHSCLLTGLITS